MSWRAGCVVLWLWAGAAAGAQTCTTQSRLSTEVRNGMAAAAGELASEVKAGDVGKLQAGAIAEYAASFESTAVVVRSTAPKLSGDSLTVTHVFELDARGQTAGPETDFSCPLAGSAAETDFAISGLPAGLYGFAMVEASGDRPWLLSFLMRQEGGMWKLAGFYAHATLAAGHDGVWFWNQARSDAKVKDLWDAWLLYNEADALLRPANFASSTNLDKLLAEERAATPPELADGISAGTPLVVKGATGREYRFTGISAEASEDGKALNLVLHVQGEGAASAAENAAAASAFLAAHKEVRQAFGGVIVVSEGTGKQPFVTEQAMVQVP